MITSKFSVTGKAQNDLKAHFPCYPITKKLPTAMGMQVIQLQHLPCCYTMGNRDTSVEELRLDYR